MPQPGTLRWPGIAQLRRVLTGTAAQLPPGCRCVTRRKLTQLEALERDAIVHSLEVEEAASSASPVMSQATIIAGSRTTAWHESRPDAAHTAQATGMNIAFQPAKSGARFLTAKVM
jgi:hypothetical protein